MASQNICLCGALAPQCCGRCKAVHYCSKACQTKDWKRHKPACKPVRAPTREPTCEPTCEPRDIEDLGDPAALRRIRERSRRCECSRCTALCAKHPGMYDPHAVAAMVERHGPEFLHGLVMDYFVDDDGKNHMHLRPPTTDDRPGELVQRVTTGVCSNLGPRGCRLSRDEMPIGCVAAHPCTPALDRAVDKEQTIEVWGTEKGREVLEQFSAVNRARDPAARLDGEVLEREYKEYMDGFHARHNVSTFAGQASACEELARDYKMTPLEAAARMGFLGLQLASEKKK